MVALPGHCKALGSLPSALGDGWSYHSHEETLVALVPQLTSESSFSATSRPWIRRASWLMQDALISSPVSAILRPSIKDPKPVSQETLQHPPTSETL